MRILLSLSLILCLSTQFATAQQVYEKHQLDTPPEFTGGEKALIKYLIKTIRYPRSAQENEKSGIVKVLFTVAADGKVIDAQVTGDRQDTALERESIRVISMMPAWQPGILKGEKVACYDTLPIKFALEVDSPRSRKKHASNSVKDTVVHQPSFITATEIAPSFPGGPASIKSYVKRNIHYPDEALSSGLEGTVTVRFTITTTGGIDDATTVGPKIGGHLEMEALRVIRSMPKWTPGSTAGKPVAVVCDYPLDFSLREYYEKRKRERLYPMY